MLDRDLNSDQAEWLVRTLLGIQLDARDVHDVTHVAAADYLRLHQAIIELADDEHCPTGLALRVVDVAQQHYKHSHFQIKVVRRQLSWLLSVRELWGLHVGPGQACHVLKCNSVSAAELMCLHLIQYVVVSNRMWVAYVVSFMTYAYMESN